MDADQVTKVVIEVLTELQEMSGREAIPISSSTCPIGDLDGFDSLNGVEATVELSERLGFDVPAINAFVDETGTKALTVAEIAAGICGAAKGKE